MANTVDLSKLKITFEGTGTIDLDMISLFPEDTWKGRKNGLRKDLVQLLYDMKPGFLRFPGGCIVEGRTLADRYQWKKSVGDVENRRTMMNRWNVNIVDYGFSQIDKNTFYLIRSYENIDMRAESQDAFYESDEWINGPEKSIMSCIDAYNTTIIDNQYLRIEKTQEK